MPNATRTSPPTTFTQRRYGPRTVSAPYPRVTDTTVAAPRPTDAPMKTSRCGWRIARVMTPKFDLPGSWSTAITTKTTIPSISGFASKSPASTGQSPTEMTASLGRDGVRRYGP